MSRLDRKIHCPVCGYGMDTFDALHESATRPPRALDRTTCWRCQTMLIFEDGAFGLRLRAMTYSEVRETLATHGEQQALLRSVKQSGGSPESVVKRWKTLHPPSEDSQP